MRDGSRPIALAAGVATSLLTWLALPGNVAWWPLLFISLVPLLLATAAAPSPKSALLRGLAVGVPFYLLQIYWIVPVLMKYGGLPWFLAVPALLLLVCYMGLYLAVFCGGFFLLTRRAAPITVIIGAAALWVGLDWLRSWLFSGFPWMDLGYAVWEAPFLAQAADLFGHAGYTFVFVLSNALLFVALSRRYPGRRLLVAVLPVAAICLAIGTYASLRWQDVDRQLANAPTALIGIVQGNVEQDRKWSPEERERTVRNYLDLSGALVSGEAPALIVWPETALPFYPRSNELLEPILDFVRRDGNVLLTGAPWYEIREDAASRLIFYYNAALLLRPDGTSATYYKTHLVPYGEYVPLQRFMPFLAPLVEAAGQFTPGRIEEPLAAGSIRAGVLICFESIFPGLARSWVDRGANVLINLTNDAWYGRSSAPYQSWAMTIFRATETRRSVVRSANTGISGVVDPLGRVQSESDLFVTWSGTMAVPLLEQRTIFVRGGWLFAPFSGLIAALILLVAKKRAQRTANKVV